jgi:L-ascorbate metabolism protein UlaG (beta-lactamase superfamily)
MNRYINNPNLSKLTTSFEWEGTPIDKKGRFVNQETTYLNSLWDVLKWKAMKNPQKNEKKKDNWHLKVNFNNDFLFSKEDCIVWLGHCSFFIRISNITILIDPVFFDILFLKRKSENPIDPNLLKGVDYILISHDHRDHCDKKSLKLLSKNNPDAIYLSGLRMDSLLRKITGSNTIQEAGWYQQYETNKDIKICFTPSRHWGMRACNDTNCRLWGGFVIQSATNTIYFSGDSGYGRHFSDIAQIFPEIDYFLIGIGTYKPEYFMSPSHLSPKCAIQAFKDSRAKTMIPMHYGTFDLSDEPLSDPIKTLKCLEEECEVQGEIDYLNPGDELSID